MNIPDIINGLMEFVGGLFVLNHLRVLYKDKKVYGVSKLSLLFFVSWGFFNLYFYGNLDQFYSTLGAIFMLLCNIAYIGSVMYYTKNSEKNDV